MTRFVRFLWTHAALTSVTAVALGAGAAAATAPDRSEAPRRIALQAVGSPSPAASPSPLVSASPNPSPSGRPSASPSAKRDGREAGYTSPHTSYVIDRGLRLQLETYANEAVVNAPFRTTVTIENLTDRPVELYGRQGCMLVVAAVRGDRRDGRSTTYACAGPGAQPSPLPTPTGPPRSPAGPPPTPSPTPTASPASPPPTPRATPPATTAAATPRATPGAQGSERIVLAPGERRSADARLFFPEAGEWGVAAHCACYEPARPRPTPTPLLGLPRLLPLPPYGNRGEQDRALVTPPIKVRAG